MSAFDQRGQKVNYQYNAAGDINFATVQNQADLVNELEKLKFEITKAGDAQVIDAEIVTDVQYQIQKAVDQSKKPEPNKNAILEHLIQAKEFIKNLAEAGGIVTGIMKAIELVQQLF
ncbi:hypothetical protein QUA40_15830 [Microcoleus sp. Pol11C3]|uniref:hypothetical protein n=1 Tax=Microcoleus sp. Pol11C3 TaxID=3055390 RepID=UPI002FD67951